MYCRVASQVDPLPLWQWKSPALSELSALFQWFRLYHALPHDFLFAEWIGQIVVKWRSSHGSNTVARCTAGSMYCHVDRIVDTVPMPYIYLAGTTWKTCDGPRDTGRTSKASCNRRTRIRHCEVDRSPDR
jgi:hypothetical protein